VSVDGHASALPSGAAAAAPPAGVYIYVNLSRDHMDFADVTGIYILNVDEHRIDNSIRLTVWRGERNCLRWY
jgi:hypothetical protein